MDKMYQYALEPVLLSEWIGDLTMDPERMLDKARAEGLHPCTADGEWLPWELIADEGIAGVYLDAPPEVPCWCAYDTDGPPGEGSWIWMSGEELDGIAIYSERTEGKHHDGRMYDVGRVVKESPVLDWLLFSEHLSASSCVFVGFQEGDTVYRLIPCHN